MSSLTSSISCLGMLECICRNLKFLILAARLRCKGSKIKTFGILVGGYMPNNVAEDRKPCIFSNISEKTYTEYQNFLQEFFFGVPRNSSSKNVSGNSFKESFEDFSRNSLKRLFKTSKQIFFLTKI